MMQSLLDIIRKSTEFLASKGVEAPRLQSELLVGHALGLELLGHHPVLQLDQLPLQAK